MKFGLTATGSNRDLSSRKGLPVGMLHAFVDPAAEAEFIEAARRFIGEAGRHSGAVQAE
jgi:hypothetical protein